MRLLPEFVHADGRFRSGLAVDVADARIAAIGPAADAVGGVRLRGKRSCPAR
jgi:hypothetical protein